MRFLSVFISTLYFYLPASAQIDIWTANYDNARTNANTQEIALTPSNVNASGFGKIGSLTVDGQIYGQPLYLRNVSVPGGGTHNLIFTATMRDTVYAFDADTLSSTPVWQVSLGTPVPNSVLNFSDIQPSVGILSTPVIDTAQGVLYAVAETYESGACIFRLHALSVADGHEMEQGPVTISGSAGGATFDPDMHLQRPGLLLQNGLVYVAFGSHADAPPYHGWLMAYDASNLQRQAAIWNSTATGHGAAIWQAGRAPAADAAGNIYVSTGNGDYDGAQDFGESFVKLSANLTLLDWYTPSNWQQLSDEDYDMGSTGAVLIPGTGQLVGGDKFGTIYNLSTGSLGHLTPAASTSAQSFAAVRWGGIFNLAVWPGNGDARLFVLEQGNGVRGFRMQGTQFNASPFAQSTQAFDIPYDGIAVSSNGANLNSAIVWMTAGDHTVSPSTGTLHAFDAQGLNELWSSGTNASRDNLGLFAKFVAPTVVNGRVYVPTFSNQLVVYGLLSPSTSPASPHVSAVTSGADFQGQALAPGEIVAIFGSGLAPAGQTVLAANAVDGTGMQLDGYSVLIGGTPAPLLYLSNNQIGAVVPWLTAGSTTTVEVTANGLASAPLTVGVAPSAPGLFTSDGSGVGQAAALNQDGSTNSSSHPAAAGSVLVLYATGGGAMDPAALDGETIPTDAPPPRLRLPVSVTIGGQPAKVLYAGAAPGLVAGVVQINVAVPAGTPPGGSVPIAIQIGDQASPAGTFVAVQ